MYLFTKRYAVVFVILLTLLFIMRSFPGSWLVYGIQQIAPGFRVAGVTGSLWQGQAAYTQWLDRGRVFSLGEFKWQLNVRSFLLLRPCFNFATETTAQIIKGNACVSLLNGNASFNDIEITLPVAQIAPFFSVELDGSIDAYIKQANWSQQQLGRTDFTLLWQKAALFNGNQWIQLGDIQARGGDDGQGGLKSHWTSASEQPKKQLVEIDVQASLTGLTGDSPAMRITGIVKPGVNNRELEPMLRFVGEPTTEGSYRIDIDE